MQKDIYTRIEIEVVTEGNYSFKVNEEPELQYLEEQNKLVTIRFGSMQEMQALAEAMLKVVEYSSNK